MTVALEPDLVVAVFLRLVAMEPASVSADPPLSGKHHAGKTFYERTSTGPT